MKRIALYLGIAAALVASCSIQEENFETPQQENVIYYATFEQPADEGTRVYANEDLLLRWTADDRVSIFGKNTYNQQYKFLGETGDNSGGFSKVDGAEYVTGNPITHTVSVYPYQEGTRISESETITLTLPAEQHYAENTFGLGANTMVSVSSDNYLQYKNVGGYLMLKLYGDGVSVSSITLKGNRGEKLAGKALVTPSLNGDPSLIMGEDASEELTLTCTEPVSIGTTQEQFTEFWFVIPPVSFSEGFSVTVTDPNGLIFRKSTDKSFTISRNHLYRMSPIEVELSFDENQLAREREALIAFYDALDGDHWLNNDNWCSDNPVGDWFGIEVDSEGRITGIELAGNNLNGIVPLELGNLRSLKYFRVSDNDVGIAFPDTRPGYFQTLEHFRMRYCREISFPDWFFDLPRLEFLEGSFASIQKGIGKLVSLREISLLTHQTPIPTELGNLTNLRALSIEGRCHTDPVTSYLLPDSEDDGGPIPDSFSNLKDLELLSISYMNCIGTIPPSLGGLTKLSTLSVPHNRLVGSIPEELGNLTALNDLNLESNRLSGEIPESLSNLPLCGINISNNQLSGEFPESTGAWFENISVFDFRIQGNLFSGKIPESWQHSSKWKYLWFHILSSGDFDASSLYIPAPDLWGNDINGNAVSNEIFKNNQLTILYNNYGYGTPASDQCFFNTSLMSTVYDKYHRFGLDILQYEDNLSFEDAQNVCTEEDIKWHLFDSNSLFIDTGYYQPDISFPRGDYYRVTPSVTVVNNSGEIVFNSFFNTDNYLSYINLNNTISMSVGDLKKSEDAFVSFLDKWFGFPDADYVSTDYSSDGLSNLLQQSAHGNGVDLIVMGDGFSDRQIADGTYSNVMEKGVDALFSEEPYKSHQVYFNVYSVNVVSATEGYEYGGQTLGTGFGNGTYVYGNDSKVIEYAKMAIPESRIDDALIIVMMNKDAYAGTCYMYNPSSGDYGRGLSIAYFPISSDTDTFNGLVSHEAGGHGFAKLADEYAYSYMGAISSEEINKTKALEPYGWWKNIDFTDNPAQVKWSRFIYDNRFDAENIGCYEGGLTYWTGVWRPTENSIMRYNTGGFNAPSRYAIWYRINKLAFGEEWNGTYEDFVTYDAINRTPAAVARRKVKNYVEKPLPPLAPPVVMDHSWREELK